MIREIRALRKSGEEFDCEIAIGEVFVAPGSPHVFTVIMRDIGERKRAEEKEMEARENAARIEQLERELSSLASLSSPPQTGVTARMYGVVTLLEGFPDTFHKRLAAIAESLGFYKAGPRDVVDIHAAALKEKTQQATLEKKKAYTGEGWIMVLELMGYLASFYRNRAQGTGAPPNQKRKIKNEDATI